MGRFFSRCGDTEYAWGYCSQCLGDTARKWSHLLRNSVATLYTSSYHRHGHLTLVFTSCSCASTNNSLILHSRVLVGYGMLEEEIFASKEANLLCYECFPARRIGHPEETICLCAIRKKPDKNLKLGKSWSCALRVATRH